jgi:hypothetical protein
MQHESFPITRGNTLQKTSKYEVSIEGQCVTITLLHCSGNEYIVDTGRADDYLQKLAQSVTLDTLLRFGRFLLEEQVAVLNPSVCKVRIDTVDPKGVQLSVQCEFKQKKTKQPAATGGVQSDRATKRVRGS